MGYYKLSIGNFFQKTVKNTISLLYILFLHIFAPIYFSVMKKISPIYILAAAILLCCGCDSRRITTIEGKITNAGGECLILEHLGNGFPTVVDTIVLDESGKFKFTINAEPGPDFFNLRLSDQSVFLVIDTLLTPLSIMSDAKTFGVDYSVGNSPENERIKVAVSQVNRLRKSVMQANAAFQKGDITEPVYRDSVRAMIGAYKQQVLSDYIYANPAAPVSYFVLFQSVGGMLIFDPHSVQDNKAYGAVATGWRYNYPASPRCSHLERLALEGQAIRKKEKQQMLSDSVSRSKIEVCNYFDIQLPDNGDVDRLLSSSVQNHAVTLLDFTAYSLPVSVSHNMKLADLYQKYREQGFCIYQVCLDIDENFWKTSADNIPWTVVRDVNVYYENGSMYSRPASIYNVSKLPTMYILTQDGANVTRVETEKDLETAIKKIL